MESTILETEIIVTLHSKGVIGANSKVVSVKIGKTSLDKAII